MTLRRQGLSRRRKAVGLTQESLAEHLGVERSTVVRWEAGDTEPLPWIRPKLARALQVSIDQLAELLIASENADTTRPLPSYTEVTIPARLPEVQSQSRAEFEDLIRPPVAETVEMLRRVLRSAGIGPEELEAMLLVGKSSQAPPVSAVPDRSVAPDADPPATVTLGVTLSELPVDTARPAHIDAVGEDIGPDTPVPTTATTATARSAAGFSGSDVFEDVPESAQTEVLPRPSLTTTLLDQHRAEVRWRHARSRRFKRFAAVSALALALIGGAASVPFIVAHRGSIPPDAAGTPAPAAPVAVIPVPSPGSGNSPRGEDSPEDSTGAVHGPPANVMPPPVAIPSSPEPDHSADDTTATPAAVVFIPRTIDHGATSRRSPTSAAPLAPAPLPADQQSNGAGMGRAGVAQPAPADQQPNDAGTDRASVTQPAPADQQPNDPGTDRASVTQPAPADQQPNDAGVDRASTARRVPPSCETACTESRPTRTPTRWSPTMS
jgi:transcriptional regulator with XRE-family HTH domain